MIITLWITQQNYNQSYYGEVLEPQPEQQVKLGTWIWLTKVNQILHLYIALVDFSRVSVKGDSPKANLHSLCSPPSPTGSQGREELGTEKTLQPHRRGNILNVTNHNIAAKWLEAPKELQASTQDTEGQQVNVLGRHSFAIS